MDRRIRKNLFYCNSMGGGAVVPAWDSVASTFIASLRSVGTAVTLAGVGLYLHHIGAIGPEGKRTLALLSQQVTFPLFLFTKTIYCNQDWSEKPCPDVTRSLADVWMLMWWPAYVVAVGLAIGWLVAKLCNTPRHQKRSVLAACGFGNSTGLPITLLNVIHTNFPVDSDLGRMDPTLFLSVFLLLYPVLQWGLGGWILAPDIEQGDDERERSEKIATVAVSDEEDDFNNTNPRGTTTTNGIMDTHHHHQRLHPPASSMLHNVLNNTAQKSYFQQHRHGLTSADESFYVTEV